MMTRMGGSWVHEYVCLSSDSKFTNATHPNLKIPNGSQCLEMDTANIYIFDQENDEWLQLTV